MSGVRVAAIARRLRREGPRGVALRTIGVLYERFGAAELDIPIRDEDIASSSGLALPPGRPLESGRPATIVWVLHPPIPGSGGHTTLFRMIAAMAQLGHRNVIALVRTDRSNVANVARSLRDGWPWLSATVRHIDDGLADADAVVASSWDTAHVIATRSAGLAVHRFYFVQDFEPYFYPRGALYSLAEDSYRFGFTNIVLGPMLAGALAGIGVESVMVPYGHDDGTYALRNTGARSGIGVYVRKNNDRRGYLMAKKAVELFHGLHPEQPVHVYGDDVPDWRVPVVRHGHLPPERLDELYNRLIAGLALSFTNISLIPTELLAAGAVPVMNDHPDARVCLPHPEAVWAEPNPAALAAALARVVEAGDQAGRAARAAQSVTPPWSATTDAFAAVLAFGLGAPEPARAYGTATTAPSLPGLPGAL